VVALEPLFGGDVEASSSSSGTSLMSGWASRTAHVESSKVGEEAAGSEEMPTRQSLCNWSGEPRPVASKMAGAAGPGGIALARVRGWVGAIGEGAGGDAWASNGSAPQTAKLTAARILNRKAPPDAAFFTLQAWGGKLKE
jgi:hypothetical protein